MQVEHPSASDAEEAEDEYPYGSGDKQVLCDAIVEHGASIFGKVGYLALAAGNGLVAHSFPFHWEGCGQLNDTA